MALLSVADALAAVLAQAAPLASEPAALADSVGRVLTADLAALRTQPPADVSAMDGYAVRAEDVVAPAVLRMIGEVAAGRPFGQAIGPGEAARIFTGAVMPPGTDTVVIQEVTSRGGCLRQGEAVTMTTSITAARTEWAARISAAWQKSVDSIIETGRLLLAAKADPKMQHGEWGTMVECDLPFTPHLSYEAWSDVWLAAGSLDDANTLAAAPRPQGSAADVLLSETENALTILMKSFERGRVALMPHLGKLG